MNDRKAVRIRVAGQVQGVGFRAWTAGRALTLAVDGWVRNDPDGSVEAVFAGPPDSVDAIVDACRQGPPSAVVQGFSEVAIDVAEVPAGFTQR